MFRIEDISYLYLLLGIPALVMLFYGLWYWKIKDLNKMGDAGLMERLSPASSKTLPWIKFTLFVLCLVFLIGALANPQLGGRKEKVMAKSSDVFIALDISQSMMAEDVSPSRLERAKRFTSRLIRALRGERIGLILFAGNAYLQMPLTRDYAASELFVAAANPNQAGTQGTSFADAITMSVDAFEPGADNQKALIIISDGEDHEAEAVEAAEEAAGEGIVIFTVAVGTEDGAYIPFLNRGREEFKVDESGQPVLSRVNLGFMADVAEAADGKYYVVTQEKSAIDDIKTQIDRLQKKEVEQESFTDFNSYYQYLLALAIFFLIVEYLLPARKIRNYV